MGNLITSNVLRHLGAQIAAAVLVGALAALNKVDLSSLGVYAPLAASFVATVVSVGTSMVNEYLGTAPQSK